MPVQSNVDLAYYKPIAQWTPRIGDYVVWHGWLQHWFGVVSQISPDGTLSIIQQGIPLLLFSLADNPQKMDENTVNIPLGEIRTSSGGKYAAIQASGSNIVWFV